MLSISYMKHGIRLTHVYFANANEIRNDTIRKKAGDLIFLHGTTTKPNGGVLYTTQHTLIKDLTLTEEELLDSFTKHLRKNIRRCERDNEGEIRFFEGNELIKDPEIFKVCERLYSKMFSDKGIESSFNTSLARKYAKQKAIIVAIAYTANKPIGFTSMITDERNARAWVGAFDFRNTDNDSYVVSRLHRYVNWKRMIYCKNKGITSFDFGGISSFEKPDPRDEFKLDFESENKVTYENYLIPNSLLGRISLKFFMRSRG